MSDDEERPRDASSAADASWAGVVVPDDISELAADIAAYHREQRRTARRARWQRWGERRGAVPLGIIGLACLLAGIVAALLTVMAPRSLTGAPAAVPLAHTQVPDGQIGGLLPMVSFHSPSGTVSTRSPTLRPAVFAVIPAHCDCAGLVNDISGQAFGESLPLAVIAPPQPAKLTQSLQQNLNRGSPTVYTDAHGVLGSALGAHGVTVVMVNRDGRIYDIERSVTQTRSPSLSGAVESMLLPEVSG